jgi:hypothetical protein
MKVGLFIPCYIDQLYSKVAVATLEWYNVCSLPGLLKQPI